VDLVQPLHAWAAWCAQCSSVHPLPRRALNSSSLVANACVLLRACSSYSAERRAQTKIRENEIEIDDRKFTIIGPKGMAKFMVVVAHAVFPAAAAAAAAYQCDK
jgi:hypothetical protein